MIYEPIKNKFIQQAIKIQKQYIFLIKEMEKSTGTLHIKKISELKK